MIDYLLIAMELLTGLFILTVIFAGLAIVLMYYRDTRQTEQTIRRNFPVLGRFRYVFEDMGEFFRQYFFAQAREEMPFNRAERSWVYRAAKNVDSTVAFGSTQNLSSTGSVVFANCVFPTLAEDAAPVSELTIGPYCKQPYVLSSLFNVSAMSYGALSKAAIRALSKGTAKAGCWLNTGEGGLSPHHVEGGGDIVNSARGFMFSLGCIQALQCNKNTCPAGGTTHDPELQKGLVPADKAERVYHYAQNMMYEVGTIAHSRGVAEPRLLRRCHANLITDTGNAVPLNVVHPDARPLTDAANSSAP